jgi:adenosylcobalamin-dependent ribonucleoside-triphosphate reductase
MKYAHRLSESFVQNYKGRTPPWGPVGYVTYKRTYARKLPNDNITEEWYQTVERCCNGILSIGGIFTQNEIETLYDYVFNLKCCFSGRALWQLGSNTVAKVGADSLQNCWHVAVDHPVDPFCFTFNQLMLGGGVGFNITKEHVYELPKVKYAPLITRLDERDVDFIVPDNREGWVELLRKILTAFFYTGNNLTYSTICIRSKGKPIKSFGGIASGSENLVDGINQIVNILKMNLGQKLKPVDCLDIMNIIGSIVVAGNVRRSAQIAIGDVDDIAFIEAKNWNKQQLPNWRSMSNNSVICNDPKLLNDSFWEGYEGNGEPYGLIHLDNCRQYGRIGEEVYDKGVVGTNPCGEITLESYEPCNLAEIFLPNIDSVEEFIIAATLLYKVCKSISRYPFIDKRVNDVVNRNHRVGVGVSGYLQSSWIRKSDEIAIVYDALKETDEYYSKELNIGKSIKLTTVKPSGTLSLLAGVTPGVHPAYAKHYIRRIRFSTSDPLVDVCRKNGYHVEPMFNYDGTRNLDTMVISFPVETPNGTVLAKDVSAVDQLCFQSFLQHFWSDNAVSMTCYYHKEELSIIKQYLKENYETIKTVSFLLHSEHGFEQAPLQEITENQYQQLSANITPVVVIDYNREFTLLDNLECTSGACPAR